MSGQKLIAELRAIVHGPTWRSTPDERANARLALVVVVSNQPRR